MSIVRLHGSPRDVVSDRGPQFTAKFWSEFCRLLGVSVSLSSGFHPQSNGLSERLNLQLKTSLRILCSTDPSSWSRNLVWTEYAHNSLPSVSMGFSPFEVVYGYPPPLCFLPWRVLSLSLLLRHPSEGSIVFGVGLGGPC